MSNWTKISDENGEYYYDSVTNESRWDVPPEYIEKATAPWEKLFDEVSQKYYYFNNVDQTTVWELPTENYQSINSAPETQHVGGTTLESEWTEYWDDSKPYYYNAVTQETRWDNPNVTIDVGSPQLSSEYTAQIDAGDWETVEDTSSGMVYYLNRSTGTTQWESPYASLEHPPTDPHPIVESSSGTGTESLRSSLNMSLFDTDNLNLPSVKSASTPTGSKLNNYSIAPDQFDANVLFDPETSSGGGSTPTPAAAREAVRKAVKFEDPWSASYGESKTTVDSAESDNNNDHAERFLEAFAVLDQIDALQSVSKSDLAGNAVKVADLVLSLPHELFESFAVLKYLSDKLLNSYTMEKFAEHNFLFDRPRGNSSQVSASIANIVDKLLSFHGDIPKNSLSSLPSTLQSDAVTCGRYIRCFMGDKRSNRPPKDIVSTLLYKMLSAPNELRDEVYCQLVKQTRNNPTTASTELGWQLILICLIAFPPSKRLLPHLFNYLSSSIPLVIETAKKFAYLSLKLCLKSVAAMQSRREIPTEKEIQAVLLGELTEVTVHALDRSTHVFRVDSFTSVQELQAMFCEKHHILPENQPMFTLFEVYNGVASDESGSSTSSAVSEERVLHPHDRVLDLVATWTRAGALLAEAPNRKKNFSSGNSGNDLSLDDAPCLVVPIFQLVFKVRYFFPTPSEAYSRDPMATQLLYEQALLGVLEVQYPYSLQDATLLAAMQLHVAIGDFVPGREIHELRGKSISNFIAKQFLPIDGSSDRNKNGASNAAAAASAAVRSEIEAKITTLYKKFVGFSRSDTIVTYLSFISSSWKLYGYSLFMVRRANAELEDSHQQSPGGAVTSELVLAVGAKGILLVDASTTCYLAEYPLDGGVTWAHSFDAFVLNTPSSVPLSSGGSGNSAGQLNSSLKPSLPAVPPSKVYFQTTQGKEIEDLLRVYQQRWLQSQSLPPANQL